MTGIHKKLLATIVFFAVLILAMPALAANPPIIAFETDGYFRGYPVIYVSEEGDGPFDRSFFGFSVSDDDTRYFFDLSFYEYRVLPLAGSYRVVYDSSELFAEDGAGEGLVEIIASDLYGNTSRVKAWCVTRDNQAPFYADGPDSINNERENILSLEFSVGEKFMPDSSDFLNDRLRGKLGAVRIASLPEHGQLSYYSEGEYVTLTQKDLPRKITLDDIHAGKLIYSPAESQDDSFYVKLENEFGSVSHINTLVLLQGVVKEEAATDTMDVPEEAEKEPAQEPAQSEQDPGQKPEDKPAEQAQEEPQAQEPQAQEQPEPPSFESLVSIDNPNETHEYYIPRAVRINDKEALTSLEGLKEFSGGYRLEISFDVESTVEVKAKQGDNIIASERVKMLAIPNPAAVSLNDDFDKIRQKVSDIRAEFNLLGEIDPFILTTPEKQRLNETLDALSWQADALELINSELSEDRLEKAQQLVFRLHSLKGVNEDVLNELVLTYTMEKAGQQMNLPWNEEGVDIMPLAVSLEQLIIQDALIHNDKKHHNLQEAYSLYSTLSMLTGTVDTQGDVFLLGMMSQLDRYNFGADLVSEPVYLVLEQIRQNQSQINEQGEEQITTNNADDIRAQLGLDDDFELLSDLQLDIVRRMVTGENVDIPFIDGGQGLLCMAMPESDEIYDLTTLRAFYVNQNNAVELISISPRSDYLMIPIGFTGRLVFYVKTLQSTQELKPEEEKELEEEQDEQQTEQDQAIADENQTEAPPEVAAGPAAPEPMQGANGQRSEEPPLKAPEIPGEIDTEAALETQEESQKEEQKANESSPGESAKNEAETNPSLINIGAFISPLYIIIGITALIVLLRIILALRKKSPDDE